MILMTFLIEHEALNRARKGLLSDWTIWQSEYAMRTRVLDSFEIVQGASGRNLAWAH